MDDLKEIAAECYRNPPKFCSVFLPHIFYEEIPWLHRGLLAVLTGQSRFLVGDPEREKIASNFTYDDGTPVFTHDFYLNQTGRRFTAYLLPGGFGKTTLGCIAFPLQQILYQEFSVGILIADTSAEGRRILQATRDELLLNEKILGVFGSLLSSPGRATSPGASSLIETQTKISMVCRGGMDRIRNFIRTGSRPDHIFIDNIENEQNTASPDQRKKLRDWINYDVLQALSPKGKISYFATLAHREALPETLTRDKQWNVLRLRALDNEGLPTWSYMLNQEQLEQKRKTFTLSNQLHTYHMQYLNEPKSEDILAVAKERDKIRNEFVRKIEVAQSATA